MNKMKSNYNEIECRYNFLKWRFVTLKRRSNKLKQPFSFWTEDNRLQAFKDNKNTAYYSYDASGERNLKLTGRTMPINQNGQVQYHPYLSHPTLYASGLITITDKGYTKHYFTEGQRICSKIGGGFANAIWNINHSVEPMRYGYEELLEWAEKGPIKTFDACMNEDVITHELKNLILQSMQHEVTRNAPEPAFYYHSDHLGSSSYITNDNGQVTQTLAYLPFGEDWVSIDNQSPYLTPYTFNGKEKDEETGFHYYGDRYYDSYLSQWKSVDRLAHKYPHLSSYVYCANNPVKYIDPNGMEIWIPDKNSRKHANRYLREQFGEQVRKDIFGFDAQGRMYMSKRAYNKFMKDNNNTSEQKALMAGMYEAVNRTENLIIQISENSDDISMPVEEFGFNSYILNLGDNAGLTGMTVDSNYYIMGMNDEKAANRVYNGFSIMGKDDKVTYTTGRSASSVFFHEILDEFLNFFTKKKTNENSSPIEKTEYQNNALKNEGKRKRTDHYH